MSKQNSTKKQNSTPSIDDMCLELEKILDDIFDEIEVELALEKILDENEYESSKVFKPKSK